ncbi:MAG: Rrf2 family transcriptional regulator [Desulfovibrio sp.]|jgi:Rrf2 family protein|nr:Rrf2 family transcriptional regulator [Desulfovibrio sp.]
MKLSAETRFAGRILCELDRAGCESLLSAGSLAGLAGVSVKFAERILVRLRRAGLVESLRGAGGGYRLIGSLDDISLGDVVRIMEGGVVLDVCCGQKANDCPRQPDKCATRRILRVLSEKLMGKLNSVSMEHFLREERRCSDT